MKRIWFFRVARTGWRCLGRSVVCSRRRCTGIRFFCTYNHLQHFVMSHGTCTWLLPFCCYRKKRRTISSMHLYIYGRVGICVFLQFLVLCKAQRVIINIRYKRKHGKLHFMMSFVDCLAHVFTYRHIGLACRLLHDRYRLTLNGNCVCYC